MTRRVEEADDELVIVALAARKARQKGLGLVGSWLLSGLELEVVAALPIEPLQLSLALLVEPHPEAAGQLEDVLRGISRPAHVMERSKAATARPRG